LTQKVEKADVLPEVRRPTDCRKERFLKRWTREMLNTGRLLLTQIEPDKAERLATLKHHEKI